MSWSLGPPGGLLPGATAGWGATLWVLVGSLVLFIALGAPWSLGLGLDLDLDLGLGLGLGPPVNILPGTPSS